MPLFTSSFERARGGLSNGQLAFAIFFATIILVAVEFLWRLSGATTGYVDSTRRWSHSRSQVYSDDSIVLIGDSRMQFDMSLNTISDRYPGTNVRQLAVAGKQPYAVIRNLANDPDFNGTIITSFVPFDIISRFREEQQPYVDHFETKWNLNNKMNFVAGNVTERYMIVRHPNYGLNSILESLLGTGSLPKSVMDIRTLRTREVEANFKLEDLERMRATRMSDAAKLYETLWPVSMADWLEDLDDLTEFAQQISARGGCLIAVRLPSGDKLFLEENRLFPKNQFWPELANRTPIIAVHFQDIPFIKGINLPDLQHVDQDDKHVFTNSLFDAIEDANGGRCDRFTSQKINDT